MVVVQLLTMNSAKQYKVVRYKLVSFVLGRVYHSTVVVNTSDTLFFASHYVMPIARLWFADDEYLTYTSTGFTCNSSQIVIILTDSSAS
jgi:hypothetical protein